MSVGKKLVQDIKFVISEKIGFERLLWTGTIIGIVGFFGGIVIGLNAVSS